MKKINLKFVIALIACLCIAYQTNAQTKKKEYREDYHYDMVSNLTLFPYGIGTCQILSDGKEMNIGAGIGIYKKIYNNFSFRGLAEVNGFKYTGAFDRYGKVLTGLSLDLGDVVYLFGDFGAAYNPSDKVSKYRLTVEGGLGLNIKLSNVTLLSTEILVDRTQVEKSWTSNGAVRLGLKFKTGLTDDDIHNIQILDNVPKKFEELDMQVKAAQNQCREYKMTLDTMNQTLIAANKALGNMRKEIARCEAEKEEGCAKGDFPDINFAFGSSSLNDFEIEKLISIADIMTFTPDNYILYGYCSDNGDDIKNKILAEDRCEKVKKFLHRLGISEGRFECVPVGKTVTYGDGQGVINQFVRIVKKK